MIVLRNSENKVENIQINSLCMNISKYNIWKKYENGILVINTNTNAIILFEEKEFEDIFNQGKITQRNKLLLKLGILVPIDVNELEEIKRNIVKSSLNSQNADVFTIFPTQKCNANCGYCFEKNEEKVDMSFDIEKDIIKYLKQNIDRENRTIIRWFGGEPLLASNVIDNVSKQLKLDGCDFSAMITTNAILLEPNLIRKAKEDWNINSIHLTIDGYKLQHSIRKGIADKNEYDRLLSNIESLLKNSIAVVCRINIDKNNMSQLNSIINDLKRFSNDKNFMVDIAPLRGMGDEYFDEQEYGYLYRSAYEKLLSNKLIRNVCDIIPKRLHENCVACVNNSVVINSKGNLFKCTLHSTKDEHKIGTIYSGMNDEANIWRNTELRNECEKCKLLPVCFGGCREFANNVSSKGISCRKIRYYVEEGMDLIYKHSIINMERECV